jgi:CHAT domain-containing protein
MKKHIIILFLLISKPAVGSSIYENLKQNIEYGNYQQVWKKLPNLFSSNQITKEEKLFLQAKILRDQGANYLSLNLLDSLEKCLKFNKIKDWGEELLLLRADVYYQLYEFDFYLKEIEWLEKWRLYYHPNDSLRKAMNYTYRAKYFSAMVNADSATFNTCKALTLFWKYRVESSNLPIYMIYANHVSCLRNSNGFLFDIGFERQKAYIDTAHYYLNKHFPGKCIEKLRIMQALAIPYYDHAAAVQTWINPTTEALSCYKIFNAKVIPILRDYKLLAGSKHPYISQIEFFIGMLEVYKLDYPKAIQHFEISKSANSSCQFEQPIFYMNWKRVSSLIKDIARIKNEMANSNRKVESLLSYRNALLEAEKVFYMRYFYNEAWKTETEDDVYGMNPFSELCWINTRLFKLTNQFQYAESAWDYAQKEKYIDILKRKFLPERREMTASLSGFLKSRMQKIRLKNDSLLLAENGFSDFKELNRNKFTNDILRNYAEVIHLFKDKNLESPFSSGFINQQIKYSIQKLQQQMKAENSAWISVNHYSNENQINTMLWVICPDSFWVETNEWENLNHFIGFTLQGKLMNYDRDSADFLSNKLYNRVFKKSFLKLKNNNIHRVYFCDDTFKPIGNPEILATNLNTGNNKYLIQDFIFTQKLMVPPDNMNSVESNNLSKLVAYSICPKLSKQFVDLTLARRYSDSIATRINAKVLNDKISKAQFKSALENSLILNLFSHGEGNNGLVFSDGNILPQEVRNFKLNSELVTLTTCESSAGKLVKGEGLKGMTEALINAGAQRVVVTNWKIDEKASSQLMLDFYKNISQGIRVDSSLWLAKLNYLKTANDLENGPSFWGGFVLFGNPNEIELFSKKLPFIDPFAVSLIVILFFFILQLVHYEFRLALFRAFKRLYAKPSIFTYKFDIAKR